MSFYLLAFLAIVLVGSVVTYVYYLKDKKEQLAAINRGFCPKCHTKGIELIDKRSNGCSGPQMLMYECQECGYVNSFAVQNGGCNI